MSSSKLSINYLEDVKKINDVDANFLRYVQGCTSNIQSQLNLQSISINSLNTAFNKLSTDNSNISFVNLSVNNLSVTSINSVEISKLFEFDTLERLNACYIESETGVFEKVGIRDVLDARKALIPEIESSVIITDNLSCNDLYVSTINGSPMSSFLTTINCCHITLTGTDQILLQNTEDTLMVNNLKVGGDDCIFQVDIRCENTDVYSRSAFFEDIILIGYSDDRLKKKIHELDDGHTSLLNNLSCFKYVPDEEKFLEHNITVHNDRVRYGLSAQEVLENFPDIVHASPINNNFLTIHYESFIPIIIQELKNINQKIEAIVNSSV